jgi:hypothetical protein
MPVASVSPLLIIVYPSLDDYIHHLARVHILSAGAGGALARYYTVDWEILPNLAMDLIVPPLTALMPVQDARRLFLALTLFLLASGTAALHAAEP